MLKYSPIDSEKLSDQFGIEEKAFEKAADKWIEVQKAIDRTIKEGMEKHEDGIMFDARKSMVEVFGIFDTQELQDILLIQLVMKDIQSRGHEHVQGAMLKAMKGDIADVIKDMLMKGEKGDNNDEDTDFEELL